VPISLKESGRVGTG